MKVRPISISIIIALYILLFIIVSKCSVIIFFNNYLSGVEISLLSQLGVIFCLFIFVIYIPRFIVDIVSFLFVSSNNKESIIFWNYPFVMIKNLKGFFHPLKLIGFLDVNQKSFIFQYIMQTRSKRSKKEYCIIWVAHEIICMLTSILVMFYAFKLNNMLIIAVVLFSFLMTFLSFISFDDYTGVLLLIKQGLIKEEIFDRYFSINNPNECIEYTGINDDLMLERLYIEVLFKVDNSETALIFLDKVDSLTNRNTFNSMKLRMKIEIGISQLQKLTGVIGKERGIPELLEHHRNIVNEFEKEYEECQIFGKVLESNRKWFKYYESLIPLTELPHEIHIDSLLLNTDPILQKLIDIGIK